MLLSRVLLGISVLVSLFQPKSGLLLWMALAACVTSPVIRRRYATVQWSTALGSFLVCQWIVTALYTSDYSLLESKFNIALVLLVVTTLLSLSRGMVSPDRGVPAASKKSWLTQVYGAALILLSCGTAFLVANQLQTIEDLRWAYWILLGAAGCILLSYLGPIRWLRPPTPWWELVVSHALSLCYAILLFTSGQMWLKLLVASCLIFVWIRMVLVRFLRSSWDQWVSGWIALTVPLVILTIVRLPQVAVPLFSCVGICSVLLLRSRIAGVFKTARERGDFDRLIMWWDAFRLSLKRPVLGVGPGNYPRYARRYAKGYLTAPNPTRHWLAATSSAHGNAPQIAAELGWAALGATVWIVLLALQTSWQLFTTVEDPFLRAFALGIGSSIIGQSVASLFADFILPCYQNGGYVNISATIYFWIMIGLLMSIDARQMGGMSPSSLAPQISWGSLGKSLIPLGGLLVLAALVEFGIQSINRRRANPQQRKETLNNHVQQRIARFAGSVGVYAKDLTSGEVYNYRSDELFPAASLFKLFVMVELMRRAEGGTIRLEDRMTADQIGISSTGPGVLRYMKDRPELSIRDCCRLMVTWSDDVATDLLLRTIEPDRINITLSQLGLSHSHVAGSCTLMKYSMADIEPCVVNVENERKLEARLRTKELLETGFAENSPSGTVTTPYEMGLLFERLFNRELISAEASDLMLEMLTEATRYSRSMIPRFQPENIAIAHRAGGSWRVLADAGLIDTQGQPLVVAILTYHHPDEKGAGDLIADLSRILFDWSRTL